MLSGFSGGPFDIYSHSSLAQESSAAIADVCFGAEELCLPPHTLSVSAVSGLFFSSFGRVLRSATHVFFLLPFYFE